MFKTIGQCLHEIAAKYADRPALIGMGTVLNWRQTEEQSACIAAALRDRGVRRGSHVGIWSYSTPLAALCFYGVVRIGAVAVMLNTSWSATDAAYALDYADVELLLAGRGRSGFPNCEDLCLEITEREPLPKLREIISIGDGTRYPRLTDMLAHAEIKGEQREAEQVVCPEDISAILFTSGTTDRSKGAMLTHFGMVNNSNAMAMSLRATENDKYLMALPMFHCFSLSGNLLSPLHSGAAVVFPPDSHSVSLLRTIEAEKCTLLNAVPTMLLTISNNPEREKMDISSLRAGILGGAPTTAKQYGKMREALRMRIISSLGQTEATAGITMVDYDADDEVNAHTVGPMLPLEEAKIVSLNTGETLLAGENGELCIRGYNVMKGYYRKRPGESVIDGEGWLHTGDMGFFDIEGNLHLTGRCKEIIIRGGENISPVEVERCILEDSRVAEVKCIGVPDRIFGEEVCACVVPGSGKQITTREMLDNLTAKLSAFKVPRYILFFDCFSKTGSGKIALSQLRAEALKRLGLTANYS
ncbi:MAG: acyl--CoA ligase [Treponema sp.]|nr:acyl--CoA ligase [Treponema sp.]